MSKPTENTRPDTKTKTLIDRFWSKVQKGKPDACWPWTGTQTDNGRATFFIENVGKKDYSELAHRFAYELHHGKDIPEGWDCRQRCQNHLCVNPRHLYVTEPRARFLTDTATPDTFSADVEQWLMFLAFQGFAALTIDCYKICLGKLATWLAENAPEVRSIGEVTNDHARRFVWSLHGQKTARGEPLMLVTRGKDIHAVRSMFRYYRSHTDIPVIDYVKFFAPRMPSTSDRAIRTVALPSHVDKMIDACDDRSPIGRRDRAILALLFSSGLRIHELVGLNRAAFPLEELGKDDTFNVTVTGKGNHTRLVFVDERAQRCIREVLDDRQGDRESALFVNFRPGADAHPGGRLTTRAVQMMFIRVTERAGLAGLGIVPHSMRHGLAVDLLKGGADLRVVQDVLGHASIVTTQRYTKIENSYLKEGYRKRKSLQDQAS